MDILNPVLNKMSIGRATKQGAQEAGEAAINSQDLCFAAVNAYFSHTLPYDDDETVVNFLQQLIADASVINEGTIAQLRADRTGRRLHRVIILHPPISYAQGVEYGVCSGSINDFFAALMTVQPDAHTVAISKLPHRRKDVKEMALKVREMIAEDSVASLDRIQVLEEDLSLLFKSLTSLYETGLIWDTENFGCTKDDMSLWTQKIAAKKKKIQDELKKACKEEEVKQELYNKITSKLKPYLIFLLSPGLVSLASGKVRNVTIRLTQASLLF